MGMNKRFKTVIAITIVFLLLIGGYLYWFSGNPYPRLSLLGKEYIDNSDELSILNEQQPGSFYLIKKYKYSKHVWAIGFGGVIERIDDFYGLGIADRDKNTILPPKYGYLYTYLDPKTNQVIIKCMPYKPNSSYDGYEYYKWENNKLIPIANKSQR